MNQQPLNILRDWINTQGIRVCEDPRQVEAYLKDFCGTDKREIFVLVQAMRQNVVADLRQGPTPPFTADVFKARLVQRLYDNLGLNEDIARWAVEGWAWVLGIEVAIPARVTQPAPSPASSIPTPKSSAPIKPSKPVVAPPFAWIADGYEISADEEEAIAAYNARFSAFVNAMKFQPTKPVATPPFALIANRYEISADGEEVIDHHTGLIWRRAVEPGRFGFKEAQAHAKSVSRQTGVAWRMPTIDELNTLIDEKRKKRGGFPAIDPVIDTDFFPERASEVFWSSSPYAGSSNSAWRVNFSNGNVVNSNRYSTLAVRLVRGG